MVPEYFVQMEIIMKRKSVLLACAGLLFCSLGAHAGTVYHVERTVGTGSVTGTADNQSISTLRNPTILPRHP